MNQSMAVAYATLGNEFLALMLSVVMVRTVVTPVGTQQEARMLSDRTFALTHPQHLCVLPFQRKSLQETLSRVTPAWPTDVLAP